VRPSYREAIEPADSDSRITGTNWVASTAPTATGPTRSTETASSGSRNSQVW
jgi:hypothetical protein